MTGCMRPEFRVTVQALVFVKSRGVVLEAGRGPVPSLAKAVAGGPIHGSWWAHPRVALNGVTVRSRRRRSEVAKLPPMTIVVTVDEVLQLAPSARSSYRQAFQNGQPILDRYGISETALRVIHFMAQVLHETAGLTIQFENLNYSAQRLPQVWPKRFKPKGPLDPQDYAHNAQKLADEVYGSRMGNTAPGDGYAYRGRGLLQTTGKDSYREATNALRAATLSPPDFVALPDEVISAQWCLGVAASEWFSKSCNTLADQDNIRKVTYAINGDQVGIGDRMEWAARTKAMWQAS
jgi:putative chitinase